jgi:hypothetical protein
MDLGLRAMIEIWAFLSDPNNQKTLAWIGGGLAAVAAAIWAVVTFLWKRKDAGPTTATTVTASRGGMAAGRDQFVGARPVRRAKKAARRRAR